MDLSDFFFFFFFFFFFSVRVAGQTGDLPSTIDSVFGAVLLPTDGLRLLDANNTTPCYGLVTPAPAALNATSPDRLVHYRGSDLNLTVSVDAPLGGGLIRAFFYYGTTSGSNVRRLGGCGGAVSALSFLPRMISARESGETR